MKYKTERMALGLAALGADPAVAGTPVKADAEARRALAQLATRYLPVVSADQNPRCVVDGITGLTYDSTDTADLWGARTLLALHNLFQALRLGAPLLTYEECEERKAKGWALIDDTGLPAVARIGGANDVMLAHYSRSASSTLDARDPFSFVMHPGVDEYMSHYLRAAPTPFTAAGGDRLVDALRMRYPAPFKLQIASGQTYWNSGQ